MSPPLLALSEIRLRFASEPLLDGAALSLAPGERIGLVGRNGSGKSSLLKIAAGSLEPDAGTRFLQPGTSLRYLPQEPDLGGHATARAYIEAGLGPADDPHWARELLRILSLDGDEAPARLSGGERRRAALARALAPRPDILLLDEPTNHLDLPTIAWLEDELDGSGAALVLTSHDRRFLERLTGAVVWLDRGETRRIDRGFVAFEAWRDDWLVREQAERHKLDRQIAAETGWLRTGVTARRKRNMGRLRALQDLRRQHREQRQAAGRIKLEANEDGGRSRLVLEAKRLSKAFDGRPIVRDLSLRIQRGDRLGIVGPNGAGKTTLLRLLTGALAPDGGGIRRGAGLSIASIDQNRASLDESQSLRDAMTDGGGDAVSIGGRARHVVGVMQDFLFAADQAGQPVSALSGGERSRLMLARALSRPASLLVLDEPTNDLDLETLDLLQELLADYPGTVLLVSHDRDVLDRTVTSILNAEGDGRWIEYAGGYTDMLAQKGPAVEPTKPPSRQPARAPQKRTKAAAPRLTFKDKHALETLPARIEALEREAADLRRRLSDRDLYARDPAAFQDAGARLAAATAELAAAEDEWLRLELLRDDVEGA